MIQTTKEKNTRQNAADGYEPGLHSQTDVGWNLRVPFISCAPLGESPNFSKPLFPPKNSRKNNCCNLYSCVCVCVWDLNEVMNFKWLAEAFSTQQQS